MSINVTVLMDNKILNLQVEASHVKTIELHESKIHSLDSIYNISVTNKLVIIYTEHPCFRDKNTCTIDNTNEGISRCNINAYDWNGNYLWNMTDIIGTEQNYFMNGSVSDIKLLKNFDDFDASKYVNSKNVYTCTNDGRLYVIDIDELKIIQVLRNK